jgi:hypothetical protein
VHWPYAIDPTTCVFAAQACAGLMLTALLLFWRYAGWTSRGVMLAAIWLTVVAQGVPGFLASIGITPGPNEFREILATGAGLATIAALLAGRPLVAAAAIFAEVPLWVLTGYATESDSELSCLHLAWLGLVLGLQVRRRSAWTAPGTRPQPESSRVLGDAALFLGATAVAAAVSTWVMGRGQGSADEWAYIYQAAVFAKGHAYAASPQCQPFLQSYYVFEREGRLFSQYTPGWPLFMSPFVAMRVGWLAAPVSLGLLAVGAARLARSALRRCAEGGAPSSETEITAAGWWAGVLATTGGTVLLNAASFYAHIFSMAAYAWMLEALVVVTTPGLAPHRQWRWGLVLGTAAAFALATRVAEGALLGFGAALYFAYALARRRVGLRVVGGAAAAFGVIAGLTLVILRLQLGKWFVTGYSLAEELRGSYIAVTFSKPKPNELKYGFPLATGAYCWWPACLPLGLAGLVTLRGRALALVGVFAIGFATYTAFCMWLTNGRGFDWGYGPRYFMPLIVPAAVGGAVALAPLTAAARRLRGGGPLALVLFAAVSGWARIVPILWPPAVAEAQRHSALIRAVEQKHLENALVFARPGTTGNDPMDLPTNLPIDLYPDQPVIIAVESSIEAVSCVRNAFPRRRVYHASGLYDVQILSE